MRNYVITHVTSVEAFMEELEIVAPHYVITDEETGKKSWTIETTPVVKSPNGTLAMSILTDEELAFIAGMETIKSLGTYEELFANEHARATYKAVYPYDVPLSYTDEDGNIVVYYLPERIGDFAR